MELAKQPEHFHRLSTMHSSDHSPAKAVYYQCKAEVAEKRLEIRALQEEGNAAMRDAGYEGYES